MKSIRSFIFILKSSKKISKLSKINYMIKLARFAIWFKICQQVNRTKDAGLAKDNRKQVVLFGIKKLLNLTNRYFSLTSKNRRLC